MRWFPIVEENHISAFCLGCHAPLTLEAKGYMRFRPSARTQTMFLNLLIREDAASQIELGLEILLEEERDLDEEQRRLPTDFRLPGLAHSRMEQVFESPQALLVGKDNLRETRPINRTVGGKDRLPKSFPEGTLEVLIRCEQPSHARIGLEDGHPLPLQPAQGSRLSAAHSPGQSDIHDGPPGGIWPDRANAVGTEVESKYVKTFTDMVKNG